MEPDFEKIAKLVNRIQKYGPRPETARYCQVEHIRERFPGGELAKCEIIDDVAALVLKNEDLLPFVVSLEDEALDYFVRRSYSYPGGGTDAWPGLVLQDSGMTRLANISGWLAGLSLAGPDTKKLAGKLALDLHKQFQNLASYGGKQEIERDSGSGTISVARYRVVLGDDGTLHGFTVNWYQCVSNKRRLAQAESVRLSRISPVEDLANTVDQRYEDSIWNDCLTEGDKQLGVREHLRHWAHYYPIYDGVKSDNMCSDVVHYGHSFNGAMIYRGPGAGETFSVSLDPKAGTERFWSVHT